MFENEEWVVVEDLPHYLVSNHGRIRHQDRLEPRKVILNDKGFPVVTLYGVDSKTRYLRQVNTLVAKAFVPKPVYEDVRHPNNFVWHIDGDLTNCRADNLRWDTRPRVLEWNEMHRTLTPAIKTPPVRNNRTGKKYRNAFECAMAEGEVESKIVWRIERQANQMYDDRARYRYL